MIGRKDDYQSTFIGLIENEKEKRLLHKNNLSFYESIKVTKNKRGN